MQRPANTDTPGATDAALVATQSVADAEPITAAVAAEPARTYGRHDSCLLADIQAARSKSFDPSLGVGIDHYYHLGLDSSMDIPGMFGDVKFVLMGGSAPRSASVARMAQHVLGIKIPVGCELAPIGKTERYTMYKVGPVLSVSHGVGTPSISVVLHELAKLLVRAGLDIKKDVTFIRIGTSGGLGLPPGSVVISTQSVNGLLEPTHSTIVLGKVVTRPCELSPAVAQSIYEVSTRSSTPHNFQVVLGRTLSTDDFFEGQGRIDGAICEHTEAETYQFLRNAHAIGVRNIEMESGFFSAFTHKLGIPAAVVCSTLLDRLEGDQIVATPEQLAALSQNSMQLVLDYVRLQLLPQAAAAEAQAAAPLP